MLENLQLQNILVLDIETVPAQADYHQLNDRWKQLWDHKAKFLAKNEESPEELYERAGIYAEFGKVICISVGVYIPNGDAFGFRIKSFYGPDEKEILSEFANLLNARYTSVAKALCGHNGKEFDFPFLSRRMLINGIKLPFLLNTAGKKPWEVNHLDTMELWKFGDYNSFTSLALLAALFDIPTPKDDIDGSMVREVYYQDKDLKRIEKYCEKDVITLANVLLKFKGLDVLEEEHIEHAE
jgi:3'-5' exonuclease